MDRTETQARTGNADLGAGEVAQLVKHFPHMHEDLSSDPWNPWKKLGAVVHIANPSDDKIGNRDGDAWKVTSY